MLRSLSYLALAVACFVTNIATARDSPPPAKTGPGELTPIDVSGFFSSAQHWRNAKLQSRCGMGVCQGRVCGAAAKVIWGWGYGIRASAGAAGACGEFDFKRQLV